MHTGEKSYVCDYEGCAEAFSQSGHLIRHKRTHKKRAHYEEKQSVPSTPNAIEVLEVLSSKHQKTTEIGN